MIDWRDITLEDKARIEDKICASGCHGADYGFANLFIWRKAYRPKIAFCDNRLLVGMPQWNVYAYPKGDGDVRNSIELLLDEAHSLGNKLRRSYRQDTRRISAALRRQVRDHRGPRQCRLHLYIGQTLRSSGKTSFVKAQSHKAL